MTKAFFFTIFMSLIAISVFSQQDSTKLLFAKNLKSAAFVELGSRVIQTNQGAGMDVSIAANWLVNHKYYLGAAYSQLASSESFNSTLKLDNLPVEPERFSTKLKYQSFGLRFGYILFDKQKIISLSPDLTVAWTGIKLELPNEQTKINGALLTPALKGVFNISSYFRIGLELNYSAFIFKKYDSTSDESKAYITQLKAADLNGVGGGIFFRIGRF